MGILDQLDIGIPLVVDLDGTSIRTDSLHENIAQAFFHRPLSLLEIVGGARNGRAGLKAAAANAFELDAEALPYRAELLALIETARKSGRQVHLATAADQSIADAVGAHLGCFNIVKGSDGNFNLKGRNKLSWLKQTFPQGFIYAGDSSADIPIWGAADGAILVGSGISHAERLREAGVAVEVLHEEPANHLRDWLSELRIHQWAKNALIFVPLFLGHVAGDWRAVVMAALAFVIFGVVASATYIINDLADLKADRLHRTKRFRALAAGRIPVAQGVAAAVGMLVAGFAAGFVLSPAFALAMAGYLVLTLAYSLKLKRVPMLDVTIIGALFTQRIVMGTVLLGLPVSPWMIPFSACFFFSLALAKRHVEIMRAGVKGLEGISGRGWLAADWPLSLGFGIAAALASIIVMLLFVSLEATVSGAYARPAWLYVAPACVFLWLQRIWLLSNRMELDDDPVVFALKDRVSYLLGAIVAVAFVLANW